MIPTINYHLIKACNYKCKFCYATFNDISQKGLSKVEQFKLIEFLAKSNLFKKINFAGGEPTLVPHLLELIKYAKNLGFITSIVTNGSKIDTEWIKQAAPYLDIIGLSVDSVDDETNLKIGRSNSNGVLTAEQIFKIANDCRIFGVNLKINTVVSRYNVHEDMSEFVNNILPFRWKILQVTKIDGQNEIVFNKLSISQEEFKSYCERNLKNILPEIKVVKESSDIIQGSYLMIDPLGRFFDDLKGKHNYSDLILEVGVEKALKQVSVDISKFEKREGKYNITNLKKQII
jgi:radical S-adenosyl methionine domain-containing protein 2